MSTPAPPWEKYYPPGVRADQAPPRLSVPGLLSGILKEHAGRIAFLYREARISYDTLGQSVAQVANALRARGYQSGDTVALYLPNSPFHPYWFFGLQTAFVRVTHLSPLDAPRELAFKCRDSGARTLVTLNMPGLVARAMALKAEGAVNDVIICDEDSAFGPLPGAAPTPPLPEGAIAHADFVAGMDTDFEASRGPDDPDAIGLFQYTGGTTGSPKAAILRQRNLTASTGIYYAWSLGEAHTRPGTRSLVVLPLFHIMALTAILMRRLKEGGTLVLHQRFETEAALEAIERHRINGMAGVPTNWIALAGSDAVARRDLSSLEIISSGGAPLPVEIYHAIEKRLGLKLRGGWGMTETCSAGTNIPENMPAEKIGTIGIPLPGVELDIVSLDDPRKVLPPGEVGEIRIRSASVTQGYWNRPEEDARSFVEDRLLTGDIGYQDADGFCFIVDRKKDLIISSGYNVYPGPIEEAIIEHPDVAEVLVIGVPDSYRGEAAKAFIVLHPGAPDFTLETLRAFLASRLGKHEMPAAIAFRTELPKTSVGKYSRKLLRDQELAALKPAPKD